MPLSGAYPVSWRAGSTADSLKVRTRCVVGFHCHHIHITNSPQCQPLAVPVHDQCEVVRDTCPASDTFLSIPYPHIYFCASPTVRPFIFFGLLLWLGFLFSTLGITASDFFCPNLATIAQLLNLDEHVAGVTFLAFGNGSPDVFATFSALRTNAGSLAIGELLGAASFIVSCVVGSMCIIKPFRVNRGPFLRDTMFFIASVATLLVILLDGQIYAWEAALLVLFYFAYVLVVVVGSWWEHRCEKKRLLEARIRSEYDEEGVQPYRDHEPYRDERERHCCISESFSRNVTIQLHVHRHRCCSPTLAHNACHRYPASNYICKNRINTRGTRSMNRGHHHTLHAW